MNKSIVGIMRVMGEGRGFCCEQQRLAKAKAAKQKAPQLRRTAEE